MKLTKLRLKQIIQEEIKMLLYEARFKEGDVVKHKDEKFGKGKVVALGKWSRKGQVSVRWPGGMLTHHESALKLVDNKHQQTNY